MCKNVCARSLLLISVKLLGSAQVIENVSNSSVTMCNAEPSVT